MCNMTVERAIYLMRRVGNALPELDELIIDDLEDDVEEHLKGMGHECPEPRCYIMTDSDSDL